MGREPQLYYATWPISDTLLRPYSLYGLVQNGFRAIQQQWRQQPSPAQALFSQTSELPSQSSPIFQFSNLSFSSADPKTPNQRSTQLPSTETPPAGGILLPNPYYTRPPDYKRVGASNTSPKSTATGSRKRPRGVETTDDSTLEGTSEKRVKRDP